MLLSGHGITMVILIITHFINSTVPRTVVISSRTIAHPQQSTVKTIFSNFFFYRRLAIVRDTIQLGSDKKPMQTQRFTLPRSFNRSFTGKLDTIKLFISLFFLFFRSEKNKTNAIALTITVYLTSKIYIFFFCCAQTFCKQSPTFSV